MTALIAASDVARTAPFTPDRVTVWPLDGRQFGVDVTYEGASGYDLASRHEHALVGAGIPHAFRQELGGAWTVRITVPAGHVAQVVARFVGDAA